MRIKDIKKNGLVLVKGKYNKYPHWARVMEVLHHVKRIKVYRLDTQGVCFISADLVEEYREPEIKGGNGSASDNDYYDKNVDNEDPILNSNWRSSGHINKSTGPKRSDWLDYLES